MADGVAVGLTASEVADRVAHGKTNTYSAASSRSAWSIVRANVFNRFNAIIGVCFVVLLVIGRWQDALFGFSAILNTFIGSAQEYRAKRSLDRIALLNAPRARVQRDGMPRDVPVDAVVLDDVMVLRAGDQVAADAVVLDAAGLELDESMLSGEADPIDKGRDDLVLSGSIVVAGIGYARATRVGADAFANSFTREARRFTLVNSELRRSIDRVLRWMSWIIPPIALLVLNTQMVVAGGWEFAVDSGEWQQAVVGTIAAVVAMVPLGLVLITSITFVIAARKLSRSSVLVQELAAVEVLARVDVVCFDKTGTLTERSIVLDRTKMLRPEQPGWDAVLGWFAAAADANATSRCLAARYPEPDLPKPSSRVLFSSERKWGSVSFADAAVGTWVLGGPEIVFPGSGDAEVVRLSDELAASGGRTLVLAWTPAGADGSIAADAILTAGLQPVALLSFHETIRPDARATLDYLAEEGVDVRIISGDNPIRVAAIAREVGLNAPTGFDARELPEDEAELEAVLRDHLVFGRVTPEQKQRMVRALKASGRTVAMTGDGVNDMLAIKEADLGIAMDSASAATKAVSRMVLLDGRFSHLPAVVAEGRRIIANIEQVSMLFLTKTAYATGLAIVFGALLLQFPILPRQESLVDGLTIGIPAFFLALLVNRQRYRPGFLRRSLSFAIPAGAAIAVGVSVYSRFAFESGIALPELRTGTTLILILTGLWVLVVLSRPITGLKALLIGAMVIGLILVFSLPVARNFFELQDLGFGTAILVSVTTAAMIVAIEVVRFLHRRHLRRLAARASASPVPSV